MDPSLLLALEISAPPARPQIVEERLWLSSEAEGAKRHIDRTLLSYRAETDRWAESLRQHRIRSAAIPMQPLLEGDYVTLDNLITDLEQTAERRAINLARSIKKARRDIKAAFKVDPSLGAVLRDAERRLHDIEEKIIDDLLEHALFVRAFKADRDPEAKGATEFSDAADLAKFLEQQRTG
jgi:hypothetical protein